MTNTMTTIVVFRTSLRVGQEVFWSSPRTSERKVVNRVHCALNPSTCDPSARALPRFLVRRVLPAEPAELAELELAGRRLLVLRRDVVAPLTVGALERDVLAHRLTPRCP